MSGKENTIVGHYLAADDDLTSGGQTATGGAQVTSESVDLQGVSDRRYRRVRVEVDFLYTLATAGRINWAATPQHSTATGSGWAAFGTAPTAQNTTATGSGLRSRFAFEQDLTTAERYYRVLLTPEFQTDTGGVTTATGSSMTYGANAILTDPNRYPASG